jgi:NADPH:quinone reductase
MSVPATTTAIAAVAPGPVDAGESFVTLEVPVPDLQPHDLLVEVRAVSVNPVDVKVRASFDPADGPKVLGYDAAGVVTAIGSEVSLFAVGDEVFYAGSIGRPGSNARLQAVDERIVGPKPTTLSFAEAAALPLTTITAWETLFERLRLTTTSTGHLVVVGGAGGVGSMIVQLASRLTGVTVLATAGRGESSEWVTSLGADHVVDRHHLVDEVEALAPDGVDWIFSPFSEGNVEDYARLLKVHGEVVAIDDPVGLDLMPLKSKSQTWHWELMFTRPLYDPTSRSQHDLLVEVSRMVDQGTVRTTATTTLSPIAPDTLREAHRRVETSAVIGKVVVTD